MPRAHDVRSVLQRFRTPLAQRWTAFRRNAIRGRRAEVTPGPGAAGDSDPDVPHTRPQLTVCERTRHDGAETAAPRREMCAHAPTDPARPRARPTPNFLRVFTESDKAALIAHAQGGRHAFLLPGGGAAVHDPAPKPPQASQPPTPPVPRPPRRADWPAPTARRSASSSWTTRPRSPNCCRWPCATRAGRSHRAGRRRRRSRAAQRDRPDAVVLDVMLPDMDGLEVLRRLRGRCPTCRCCSSPPRTPWRTGSPG